MKTSALPFATFLFCSLFGAVNSTFSQGTAFTYQGRLNNTGAPASGNYDFVFSLYDDSSAGTQQGAAQTNSAVAVSNGLFTTALDFGGAPLNGQPLWLQLLVRTNANGPFTPLTPRQPLTPSPYSITASNLSGPLPASQISGTILNSSLPSSPSFSGAVSAAGGFSGNGSGLANVNAATLGGFSSSSFWQLGGNGGTSAGAQFLGTTDDKALEFKVNGGRAFRLEPNGTSPNVIGGYRDNLVLPGVSGATMSGGGQLGLAHAVIGDFGVVGGGLENTAGNLGVVAGGQHGRATALRATVGGGGYNEASGVSSTVAGGEYNVASGDVSSVGGGSANEASVGSTISGGSNNVATGTFAGIVGGQQNSAENTYTSIGGGVINTNRGYAATVAGGSHNLSSFHFATVGGGQLNIARGLSSTVGGGLQNISSGEWATVPGGFINTAAGDYSFAAGHQAKANHAGAFVWSDSVSADFASTGPNQFLIRAAGGVGINTSSPAKTLDVWDGIGDRGSIHVGGPGANGDPKLIYFGDGDFVHIGENGQDDTMELRAARFSFVASDGLGNVGIGFTNASYKLHVNGMVAGIGPYVDVSDARYKTNVSSLQGALDKVLHLQGVSYDWRQSEFPGLNFDSQKQLGFIAQDVAPILPEVVSKDDNGFYSIAYSKVVPVLVEAIKEQQRSMNKAAEEKDAKIATLEKEVAALRQQTLAQQEISGRWAKRLAALEKAMAAPARD